MDRMIMMVGRMIMGRLMRTGINKGMDMAAKRRAQPEDAAQPGQKPPQQNMRRVNQAMRIGRRMGRF